MGWKKLSYWLRGGIIGGVLAILFSLSSYILPDNLLYNSNFLGVIISFMIFIPMVTALFISNLFGCFFENGGVCYYLNLTLGFVSMFVFYFIIGAIIGWLYGKIRNRKNKINYFLNALNDF